MKIREWRIQDLGTDGEVLRDVVVPTDGLEIGRTAQGLRCADDPQMSAQHARLFVQGEQAFVEELGSTTGVWLRVRAGQGWGLKEEDQVWLGSQILLIRRRGEAWELRHHGPDGRLREKHLVPEKGVFLGRTSDLVLDREDSRLSRRHAQIIREGDALRLYDRGAHNGTYIKLAEPILLQDGDEFRLATHRFRVEAIAEAVEAAPAPPPPAPQPKIVEPLSSDSAHTGQIQTDTESPQKGNRRPSLAARLKKLGRREVAEAPVEETEPVSVPPSDSEAAPDFAEEATVMVSNEEEISTGEQAVAEVVEAAEVEKEAAADSEQTEIAIGVDEMLGETLPPSTNLEDVQGSKAATFEIVLERGAEAPPLSISASAGQTLLEAVQAAGLERGEPIDWECGDGGCGVCVVGLVGEPDGLEPPDPSGDEMKTIQITEQVAPDPAQYRLACLARVRGNVRLRRL